MNLGPQFTQLAMFHQAKDFVGDRASNPKIHPMDVEAYEPNPARNQTNYQVMWQAKSRESSKVNPATGRNLRQTIAQRIDQRPVDVWHHTDTDRSPFDGSERGFNQPALYDGHHRAISYYKDRGPKSEVPVEHYDNENQGWGRVEPSPRMLEGYRPPKGRR